MFDSSLAGRIVTVVTKPELIEKDPKRFSSYYDGEYFVMSASQGSLCAVKMVGGYDGHRTRTFTANQYDVLDAYDDDVLIEDWLEDLEHFAGTLKRGEEKRWVESVYCDAAGIVRRARRTLGRRQDRVTEKEAVEPAVSALHTFSGVFLVRGTPREIEERIGKHGILDSRFLKFVSKEGAPVLVAASQIAAIRPAAV